MKKITLVLLTILSLSASSFEWDDLQLSVEEVNILLRKDLPNEIQLKERLRIENPELNQGEIRGHKVGNGFSLPTKPSRLKEIKECQVLNSSLTFLVLQDQNFKLYAVLTENRREESLAEFLEVEFYERSVGFRTYQFLIGTNPLRGEMFQIEWLKSGSGVLRIVYNEKLHHYQVSCL